MDEKGVRRLVHRILDQLPEDQRLVGMFCVRSNLAKIFAATQVCTVLSHSLRWLRSLQAFHNLTTDRYSSGEHRTERRTFFFIITDFQFDLVLIFDNSSKKIVGSWPLDISACRFAFLRPVFAMTADFRPKGTTFHRSGSCPTHRYHEKLTYIFMLNRT